MPPTDTNNQNSNPAQPVNAPPAPQSAPVAQPQPPQPAVPGNATGQKIVAYAPGPNAKQPFYAFSFRRKIYIYPEDDSLVVTAVDNNQELFRAPFRELQFGECANPYTVQYGTSFVTGHIIIKSPARFIRLRFAKPAFLTKFMVANAIGALIICILIIYFDLRIQLSILLAAFSFGGINISTLGQSKEVNTFRTLLASHNVKETNIPDPDLETVAATFNAQGKRNKWAMVVLVVGIILIVVLGAIAANNGWIE